MSEIRLQRLRLQNFKGISDFTLDMGGESASIYAENGKGKTTCLDGWLWLLFGKDSLNQANFDIKPLDADGKVIPGLESVVEAVLTIDREELTLKKSYQEKYTKKRGSAQAELTGHTIEYWIDGVPVKQGEYQDRIRQIVDEKLFRTLSDCRFFNESLKWEDRRKILLDVCGDVADSDVIASSKELERLPGIVGKRTLDEYRKIAAGRKTEINKQLQEIPARIDEANKGKADTGQLTKVSLEDELNTLAAQKKAKEDELRRIQEGGEVAEKTKRLREIEAKIQEAQNKERAARDDAEREKRLKIQALQDRLDIATKASRNLEGAKAQIVSNLASIAGRIETLRSEWHRINDKPFNGDSVCPTCGREYEEDRKAHILAIWNAGKANTLGDINERGKGLKEQADKLQLDLLGTENESRGCAAEIEDLDRQMKQEEGKAIPAPEVDQVLVEMQRQKLNLECEIQSLQNSASSTVEPLQIEIAEFGIQITEKQTLLAQIDSNYRAEARIRELMKQEKDLAGEYERLEGELFLCDLFIKTKVAMLDEKINGKFEYVRFRLFSENINGGIEPTCVCTINGVPYNSANEASRINSGISIANVLADHYGLYLPSWIDGAESCLDVIKSKNQQIKLIVSKDHPQLTVKGE
jgi:DNA repair exonuclease SbcCD ATPase subunit